MVGPSYSKKTMFGVFFVISTIVVISVFAYLFVIKDYLGEMTRNKTTAEKVVDVLRKYEKQWSEDDRAQWEEKKTSSVDVLIPFIQSTIPRFEPGKPVVRVGDEQLYTDDFNYRLFVSYPQDFAIEGKITSSTLEKVYLSLSGDSILLQESSRRGWVTLEDSFFDSIKKNYQLRGEMITTAENQAASDVVATIEGEKIEIWFYNMEPPEMGVQAAQEIALQKITALRERLLNGTITFAQAGAEIKADPVLRKIDPAVDGNAYSEFQIMGTREVFHDPEILSSIQGLSSGQITEILTGRDKDEDWYDAFYMVARVTNRTEGAGSYKAWLSELRDSYDITLD